MEAVLARSAERGFQGTRLLQAAFHNRSLSLYTKLGFDTREPISTMQGPPIKAADSGLQRTSRAHVGSGGMQPALPNACMVTIAAASCATRSNKGQSNQADSAVVAERDGRIVAYATSIGFFGHMVGESNSDVQALIANADAFRGAGHSRPDAKRGSVPMVPGERPPRGAADDPHDSRLLQRARRGLSSVDTFLSRESPALEGGPSKLCSGGRGPFNSSSLALGVYSQQVSSTFDSPLRCAPVGMTSVRRAL